MIWLGKIALAMTGVVFTGAGIVCSEGFVQVTVIEKEPQAHHINVMAPAMLAPIAAHFIPQRNLRAASQRLHEYLPVIDTALEALRNTGDVILVEVKEPNERVQVMKSGGSLVVDVDDPDETVHVSAPLRAISGIVDQIAAAAGPTIRHSL